MSVEALDFFQRLSPNVFWERPNIFCTYWLNGKTRGENIWLDVMVYESNAERDPKREPNISYLPNTVNEYILIPYFLLKMS